jgi:large subunit ribosomal protein L24
VHVISGKDRGKQGKVLRVIPKLDRVLVEGVNVVTRHLKKQGATPGQIIKSEKAIHVSRVLIYDADAKQPSRVGYRFEGEKKVRISKKSQKSLA